MIFITVKKDGSCNINIWIKQKKQRKTKAGSRYRGLWKFALTWLSNPLKSLLNQNLWSWDNNDEVHFAEVAEVQALAAAVSYSTHLG